MVRLGQALILLGFLLLLVLPNIFVPTFGHLSMALGMLALAGGLWLVWVRSPD